MRLRYPTIELIIAALLALNIFLMVSHQREEQKPLNRLEITKLKQRIIKDEFKIEQLEGKIRENTNYIRSLDRVKRDSLRSRLNPR